MYTTGELARMCHASQRMVRHYDKIGLLKPTAVGENGYRYYDDEAIDALGGIMQLRRYGLSLAEIGEALGGGASSLERALSNQIGLLKSSATQQAELIAEIEHRLSSGFAESLFQEAGSYDVQVGMRSEQLCLCKRMATDEAHITDMIDELFQLIRHSEGITAVGPQMVQFHEEFEYNLDDMDVEACIPVALGDAWDETASELDAHGAELRTLPGGLMASTIHLGIYEQIGGAYRALSNWAAENGYRICGDAVERYFKDYRDTPNRDAFITEVAVPLAKTGPEA